MFRKVVPLRGEICDSFPMEEECDRILNSQLDRGKEATSRQHAKKQCRSFQSGGKNVENHTRKVSGRPSSTTIETNTIKVEEMIKNDQPP